MSTTTNIDTLKINYLTQAQYDSALANSQINENELYLTPSASFDGATSSTAGKMGLVPAPASGNNLSVLFGDTEWGDLLFDPMYENGGINLRLVRGLQVPGGGGGHTDLLSYYAFSPADSTNPGLMSSTDKIKLDNVGIIERVGAITGEAPSDVSIASGAAWKELCNFTLSSGVWMVSFSAQFASNATGARAVTLGTATNSAGTVVRMLRSQAVNGQVTTLSLTVPVEHSSSTTYYINCYQTSGTTLTVQSRYTAVKIGESTTT